jgi:hypothetical protein
MAEENQAATATANAPSTESAPGATAALSKPKAPILSPELKAAASFDVEDVLAGMESASAGSTETKSEGAEPATETTEDTTSESESSPDAEESASQEGEEESQADDAEESDDAPEGLKPKAIKRFNRLLEQRNEAKAAARKAEAELAELKTKLEQRQDEPTPVKAESNPLLSVTNEEQLEAYENHYAKIKAWCRRNPQGGVPPKELTGGAEMELDADAVISNLENAETMLDKALPNHRKFLSEFQAKRQAAKAAHPQIFTPGTPEHEAAKALRPKLLNFASQPEQDELLALMVKAQRMQQEERDGVARYTRVELKKTTPAKPAAAVKPAPKPAPTGSPVPPVKQADGKSTRELALAKLNQQGAEIDVEELLA